MKSKKPTVDLSIIPISIVSETKELDRIYAVCMLILCIPLLIGFGSYLLIATKAITTIEIITIGLLTATATIIGYLWGSSIRDNGKEDTKEDS